MIRLILLFALGFLLTATPAAAQHGGGGSGGTERPGRKPKMPKPLPRPLPPGSPKSLTGQGSLNRAQERKITIDRSKDLPVKAKSLYQQQTYSRVSTREYNSQQSAAYEGRLKQKDVMVDREGKSAQTAAYQGRMERSSVRVLRRSNRDAHLSIAYKGQQGLKSLEDRRKYHERQARKANRRARRNYNPPHERKKPEKPKYDKSERSIWYD
ncbi:MAG: hypothetical protein WBA12_05565 [Catalinimonas sp.]